MKKLSLFLLSCCLLCSFMPIKNAFATNARDMNFMSMSEDEFIEKMGPFFTEDQRRSGILASVSMAQCILESGWGKSELAQEANNLFGMKFRLSGVDWTGRKYTKKTQEYIKGKYVDVVADFRAYDSIEDSIRDHSDYLINSVNREISPESKRYAGLQGCDKYRVAASILKNGGYATSPTYVERICSIIEQYTLTRFDVGGTVGSRDIESRAKCTTSPCVTERCQFLVRVKSEDLHIASKPDERCFSDVVTHAGVFTIVEKTIDGEWGRLKSGAGWIKLGGLERL